VLIFIVAIAHSPELEIEVVNIWKGEEGSKTNCSFTFTNFPAR